MQLNPAQQEKVKSLVSAATGLPLTKLGTYGFVGAATGPTGSTMSQAGQAAQGTRGPISDEGTQMKMGGVLNEVVKKVKPIATAEIEELPTVINFGKTAFKLDDLVVQGKVLKQRFGDNHPVVKLYNNLISGKGGYDIMKPDSRGLETGAVDTLQRQAGIYSPYEARNNKYKKSDTTDEMGIIRNKKGQAKGTNVREEGVTSMPFQQLFEFLKERGVKPYRSLEAEKRY